MARLRKGVSYRRMDARPYTRISKYRKKSFVRARPHVKVVKYDMGELKKVFRYAVYLKTNETLQLRHNALESARQAINRALEKNTGKGMYSFKLRVYPHHILRENPLASGAGADRLSTGMKNSFGKSIGTAARVRKGQIIFEAGVDTLAHAEAAKKALKKGSTKLPKGCTIEIIDKQDKKKKLVKKVAPKKPKVKKEPAKK